MRTEDYRHVRNPEIRGLLRSDPETVTIGRLERALIATHANLLNDRKRTDVPPQALAARIEHQARAERAFIREHVPGAVQALRDMWVDAPITRKGDYQL